MVPRMRTFGALLLAFATLPASAAETKKPKPAPAAKSDSGGAPSLPVSTFTLKNGLTVVVSEDHTAPIVAVELWYHVGSKDEPKGRSGFAHLFEHMMFKGSAHVADGEHFKKISEAGGTNNASTNPDRTNYHEVLPSNFLARALWLESDRMGFLLDTLTLEKLDNQRDVVRNERRQNYENRPYGMAYKAIAEALYPEDHPYHHLTIGDHADLEKASLDDVKQFFRDWYTPSNASLVVVGDTTVAEVKKLAETYFEPLPSHPPLPGPTAQAVKLDAEKRLALTDKVSLERVYLVWPSPANYAPGDAELDLLGTILSSRTGRLYEKLVHSMQVAQSVQAEQGGSRLAGEFEIIATARPGHTAAELEKLIDEEIKKLIGDAPVTQAELDRARNGWEARFVYSLEDARARSTRINDYLYNTGKADGIATDFARYRNATVDGVMKAARSVLGPGRVVLAITPAPKAAKTAAPAAPAPAAPAAKTSGGAK